MNITTKQFKQFSDIVYQECGIYLHDGKQQLLQARVAKRLRTTGINSIPIYLERIEKDPQELKSVHNNPEYAGVLADMKALYQQLRVQYDVK